MPGSHIPMRSPETPRENLPDYVVIVYWIIADEVQNQLIDLFHSGVPFVTAVPKLIFL